MKINIALLTLLVVMIASCKKSTKVDKTPQIGNLQLSTEHVRDQNPADTVFMVFEVRDGDGNLDGSKPGIFLKDNWGSPIREFVFPEIPENIIDPEQGIVATCTIKAPAPQFFFIRPDNPPKPEDSIRFELYVTDKDSNVSNTLLTPYIHIYP